MEKTIKEYESNSAEINKVLKDLYSKKKQIIQIINTNKQRESFSEKSIASVRRPSSGMRPISSKKSKKTGKKFSSKK